MGESVLFTLAHISDWHATTLEGATYAELATKRFWGWQSWLRKRRKRHRPEVLARLFEDLHERAPDHVVVTGDLTNVALAGEFAEAAGMLRELGDPDFVSLVPGNHDAYVAIDARESWDHWAPYLAGDPADATDDRGSLSGHPAAPAVSAGAAAPAPLRDDYPTLWVRGSVAIVGLCSALPTPLFMASGELGAGQLERLEEVLLRLGRQRLFRVVALHHPPSDRQLGRRRQLHDWRELQGVLRRAGAELVVHGHLHRTCLGSVPGPAADIPVAGVRSASDIGVKEHRRAQYHLYRIDDAGGRDPAARVSLEVRGYDPAADRFIAEGEVRAL